MVEVWELRTFVERQLVHEGLSNAHDWEGATAAGLFLVVVDDRNRSLAPVLGVEHNIESFRAAARG